MRVRVMRDKTLHRKSVLIVDDDAQVCGFIEEVAQGLGLRTATAQNSHQFRDLLEALSPGLIVLDLNIPGGQDGIELLRFLADQDCRADIVLNSGFDEQVLKTAKRLAESHGLNLVATLHKPNTVEALEAALSRPSRQGGAFTAKELQSGIANREITAHYQPKVNLRSEPMPIIESVEALARWDHPCLGPIAPGEFVPLAEDSGLIVDLTDLMLEAAIDQLTEWRQGGLDFSIAVNVSPVLLADLGFPDRLGALLARSEVPSSRLSLEITESGAMADVTLAMETLSRLCIRGVSRSLDDFGTGFSSLVQLYRLPFRELKIDKFLVLDLAESEEAQIIVRSVIDLAHNLGMQSCAEGVEDPEALVLLQSFGCDLAQGYLFSPPVPKEEITQKLHRQSGRVSAVVGAYGLNPTLQTTYNHSIEC